eukprot:4468300-Prymnesium_polylepis.1
MAVSESSDQGDQMAYYKFSLGALMHVAYRADEKADRGYPPSQISRGTPVVLRAAHPPGVLVHGGRKACVRL